MKKFADYIKNKILLAPMAGVTDSAFRTVCRQYGADLVYTEMVSAKALSYQNKKTRKLLYIGDQEKPVGIQLFGSDPQTMAETAKAICEAYEGDIVLIDINMGCPAPKIVNNGEGCALMKDPRRVGEIVYAVKRAIHLPLTVKIRKGFNTAEPNAVEVAKICEENGADSVTVHGRTRDQYYSGKADYTIITEVKAALNIPVIGNGDIFCGLDAKRMFEKTGVDAVMVARGALGNPFIFRDILSVMNTGEPAVPVSAEERAQVLMAQAKAAVKQKGEKTAIVQMRKHAAWYIKGMPNAARLRERLVRIHSLNELDSVINGVFDKRGEAFINQGLD